MREAPVRDSVDASSEKDALALRRAFGHFATGITVITAAADQGPIGITANSFSSLSLSPPLLLWSLDSNSAGLEGFKNAEGFCVNVLAENQINISKHFATKQRNKFSSVLFDQGVFGCPVLHGCIANFQCRTTDIIARGDHHIFIGQVLEYDCNEGSGLIYQKGRYATAVECTL